MGADTVTKRRRLRTRELRPNWSTSTQEVQTQWWSPIPSTKMGADTAVDGTRYSEPTDVRLSDSTSTKDVVISDAFASGTATFHELTEPRQITFGGVGRVDNTHALSASAGWFNYFHERLHHLGQCVNAPGYPRLELVNEVWSSAPVLLAPATPTPSVVPAENGGIDLIWHRGGWDIVIEFRENEHAWLWAKERASGEPPVDGELDQDEVRQLWRDLREAITDAP
jgi:hypothetical protein